MTRLTLHPGFFTESERALLDHGGIRVTTFAYPSGCQALRIDTGPLSCILLPFQGQQIWDARAYGRRLTMRSMFDDPIPTRDYLRNYGAFFLHCGGTAMGNPGPEDSHPLHGELPNLPFASAELELHVVAGKATLTLTGVAQDRLAFDHHFSFRPRLTLTAGSALFDLQLEVSNHGPGALPFAYLAHINFAPVVGARLKDTVRDDHRDILLRPAKLPDPARPEVSAFHQAMAQDLSYHRDIRAEERIEPESVMTMQVAADADGWAHALQLLPDGSADLVSHRPADLPHAVRWMTRASDRQALGLILPATAAPNGRAAAERSGQILRLPEGSKWTSHLRFGAIPAETASALAAEIDKIG